MAPVNFAGFLVLRQTCQRLQLEPKCLIEAGHGGSGMTTVANGGEVAMTATRAKSGPFPLIGITGKALGLDDGDLEARRSPHCDKAHDEVHTTTRHAVELW